MRSSASLEFCSSGSTLLDHVIAIQLCEVLRDLALAERVIQRYRRSACGWIPNREA